jgi:hypothetical protein
VSSLDLSRLSPGDAEVALRSFGRRYRAELRPVPDDDRTDELAGRLGPDGESALDVVSDVTRTLGLLGAEMRRTLTLDRPVLHPAVADGGLRHWDAPAPDSVDDALRLLDAELDDLLDTTGLAANGDDWTRQGTVADGGSRSALDLLKEAVRVAADGLDRVRAVLAAVGS